MKASNAPWAHVIAWSCLVLCARGAVRQSVDYAITSESCGDGGGSAMSTDYEIAGTAEAWCGTSSAVSPDERLCHGFAGQQADVATVVVAAAPASLDEEATRLASVTAALDDATILALTGSEAAWTVGGWPLATVNAAGLVTAAAVYADTSGVVRARYDTGEGSLSLRVLNAAPDNFGSYAGDLLDDAWQVGWFGLDNPDAAPGADSDVDLQDNRYEHVTGTDPTDGASRLRFWLETASGVSAPRRLSFAPLRPGRTYTLLARTNSLAGEGLWVGQPGSAEDDGETRTITDNSTAVPLKFYRLKVDYP